MRSVKVLNAVRIVSPQLPCKKECLWRCKNVIHDNNIIVTRMHDTTDPESEENADGREERGRRRASVGSEESRINDRLREDRCNQY